MPISSDPQSTAPYWLACDADKPEETRPTFICRFMTRREHRRVDELVKQAYASKKDDECFALLVDALRVGIVGWRNVKDHAGNEIPFDLSNVDAVLTDREIWEAAYGYPQAVSQTERERFLSRSQSQPIGESSAATAATSATTNLPNPVPSGSVACDAPGPVAVTVTTGAA